VDQESKDLILEAESRIEGIQPEHQKEPDREDTQYSRNPMDGHRGTLSSSGDL
jgi:hypothetical protein